MGSMYEGMCSDKTKTVKTKEQQHLYNMERAYQTLKHIAEGGGTNPRIYAQNTIDAIRCG